MKTLLLILLLSCSQLMAQLPCTNDCAGGTNNPSGPTPKPAGSLALRISAIMAGPSPTNTPLLCMTNFGWGRAIQGNMFETTNKWLVTPADSFTNLHFTYIISVTNMQPTHTYRVRYGLDEFDWISYVGASWTGFTNGEHSVSHTIFSFTSLVRGFGFYDVIGTNAP